MNFPNVFYVQTQKMFHSQQRTVKNLPDSLMKSVKISFLLAEFFSLVDHG